jgi:hypothetical protein
MEILTALLLLVTSAIVIVGARQIGVGWRDDGPAPGFFPFYIALLMGFASIMNLLAALRMSTSHSFVGRSEFARVLTVLVPAVLYVALIGGLHLGPLSLPGVGLYVASFVFLLGFMIVVGREPVWKAITIATGVPVVAFFMFERWFKVALPKGPLEAWLGLG